MLESNIQGIFMIKKFRFSKLIRDHVPEILKNKNASLKYHVMSDEEYLKRLNEKLMEETLEVLEASSREEFIEEFSDVIEVIYAIAKVQNIDVEEIERERVKKREVKGGFEKKFYADSIELHASHPHVAYYEAKAHKYPEIE